LELALLVEYPISVCRTHLIKADDIRANSGSRQKCLRACAYDVDAEGDKGAARLGQLSLRMQRVRPPVGKDVTAFWQAGGRVRDWMQFELARLRGLPRRG
jgi:hypothetical protein